MKRSSTFTSWLPVPRMPRVSQLSATVTPSDANGTARFSTRCPRSGSSYVAMVDIAVPAVDWLANRFVPLTR